MKYKGNTFLHMIAAVAIVVAINGLAILFYQFNSPVEGDDQRQQVARKTESVEEPIVMPPFKLVDARLGRLVDSAVYKDKALFIAFFASW